MYNYYKAFEKHASVSNFRSKTNVYIEMTKQYRQLFGSDIFMENKQMKKMKNRRIRLYEINIDKIEKSIEIQNYSRPEIKLKKEKTCPVEIEETNIKEKLRKIKYKLF
jgi:hypothetical protein